MLTWLPIGGGSALVFPVLPHKMGVQWALRGPEEGSAHAGPGSRCPAAHIAPDLHILEEELIIEGALAETQVTRYLERKDLFVCKQLKNLSLAGPCLDLCVLLSFSVHHTDPGAALDIEAQGLLGPLSCVANAHSGCCHHSWLPGPRGAVL